MIQYVNTFTACTNLLHTHLLTHTYCMQKTNANLWCLEHEQTCIHNHQTSKHKLKHTSNDISFQSEIKNSVCPKQH